MSAEKCKIAVVGGGAAARDNSRSKWMIRPAVFCSEESIQLGTHTQFAFSWLMIWLRISVFGMLASVGDVMIVLVGPRLIFSLWKLLLRLSLPPYPDEAWFGSAYCAEYVHTTS